VRDIAQKGSVPSKYSRICSDLFCTTDFYRNPGVSHIPKLKPNPVPSKLLIMSCNSLSEYLVKVSISENETKNSTLDLFDNIS